MTDGEWHPKPHQCWDDFCQESEASLPIVVWRNHLPKSSVITLLTCGCCPPAQLCKSFHIPCGSVILRSTSKPSHYSVSRPEIGSGLHRPYKLSSGSQRCSMCSHLFFSPTWVIKIHQQPLFATATPRINIYEKCKAKEGRSQSGTNHSSHAGTVATTGEKMLVGLWTCPSVSPHSFNLAYLSSRNPQADVFHSHNAFVRKVVDLCEVLKQYHIKVSFARLYSDPLCLNIPIFFSHRQQEWGFAMHFVKQEPKGRK